jgi:sugar transferase (PEP-CTERM/EpsH1 system associated)
MNLLYLSQRLPYPADRGDRIATFHQIKYLSRKHRIFIATLIESDVERKHAPQLLKYAAGLIAERQGPAASLGGKLASLFRGEPLTLGHYWNTRLNTAIAKTISDCKIDAALIFSSSMAQYLERHDHLTRVMHFCDVDSQKWAALAHRAHGPKRWIYRREARLLLEYERKIAKQFDASCVVSEGEAELFRRLIPGAPVSVVENGVELNHFQDVSRKVECCELTFVGVMDYPPNEEAVCYFVRDVWPQVRTQIPSAKLVIVGAKPTQKVRALASEPGVSITGYVEDIRPFLARSSLAVIPLAIARGIQNKVIEAIAAGVPVLTTPVVAKNLCPEVRDAIFVAERDPAIFAKAVLEALQDPNTAEAKAMQALKAVAKRHSWEYTANQLEALIQNPRRRV